MNDMPRDHLRGQCQCRNILFEGRNCLFMANRKGKRKGKKQDHRDECDIANPVGTQREPSCQYFIRFPFTVGNIHRIKHLNKYRRKEAKWNGEQDVAEKFGGLWEGGYIGEIPVRDHRKTEHDYNPYFNHHHWPGNLKQQPFTTRRNRNQYGENRDFIK